MKLDIDLLPRGAWGNNLSKTLPAKDWDRIRAWVYKRAGYRCAVCGRRGDLEAHEVWDFDDERAVQTLRDIVALCPACHGVKHFRHSERIGYGEQAKTHFMVVNRCTKADFARAIAEAMILFDARNEILRWKVVADLERFGGEGITVKERHIPLIVNPYEGVDWERVGQIKIGVEKIPNEIIFSPKYEKPCVILLRHLDEQANQLEVKRGKNETVFYSAEKRFDEKEYSKGMQRCPLPPRVCSLAVDNYEGTITVSADYVNRIRWEDGEEKIQHLYNIGGRFCAKFSVEDLRLASIRFRLTGNGETVSELFHLRDCKETKI